MLDCLKCRLSFNFLVDMHNMAATSRIACIVGIVKRIMRIANNNECSKSVLFSIVEALIFSTRLLCVSLIGIVEGICIEVCI